MFRPQIDMTNSKYAFDDIGITIERSTFEANNGINEHHLILHVAPRNEMFVGQYQRICEGEKRLLGLSAFKASKVIMRRYFLSDSSNQVPLMKEHDDVCAYSYISAFQKIGRQVRVQENAFVK